MLNWKHDHVYTNSTTFFHINKIIRTKYCRDVFENVERRIASEFSLGETKVYSTAVRRRQSYLPP